MAVMAQEAGEPDEVLVAHAKAGDRDAFSELVGRHYDFIHRVAWNLPRPAKPVSLASEREARRQHPDSEVPPAA